MAKIKLMMCFFISFHLGANHLRLNLQNALNKKLVETKVISLGGYQGLCINMTLKNLTKDSLIVLVEAGRRLNSIDDKNQDILIVKEQIIALKMKEEKSFDVKGYCCQAHNLSPHKGARYNVNKLADSNLVCLANYLNTNEFDKNAEQEAVWSLSDKRSAANINGINDTLIQALRERIALIKGEKLPWYRIISRKYVFSNGVINIINLKLQGVLIYSNEKEVYATLTVTNEKGVLVCCVKSEWLKMCLNENYKLDLPIKGLAKGKYRVELKTPEKQLAKQEFEI